MFGSCCCCSALPAAVAAGVVVVLWWRGPNWSLLFGNLSDSDAGSVVQSLQAAGIEHKLEDGGAIMVPAEHVHDARLQLASQGLPQGKNVEPRDDQQGSWLRRQPVHGERTLSIRTRE
jgi:flagellar biosynthesis/type III secretory pathway M-ring protein FliF/YscJ